MYIICLNFANTFWVNNNRFISCSSIYRRMVCCGFSRAETSLKIIISRRVRGLSRLDLRVCLWTIVNFLAAGWESIQSVLIGFIMRSLFKSEKYQNTLKTSRFDSVKRNMATTTAPQAHTNTFLKRKRWFSFTRFQMHFNTVPCCFVNSRRTTK